MTHITADQRERLAEIAYDEGFHPHPLQIDQDGDAPMKATIIGNDGAWYMIGITVNFGERLESSWRENLRGYKSRLTAEGKL